MIYSINWFNNQNWIEKCSCAHSLLSDSITTKKKLTELSLSGAVLEWVVDPRLNNEKGCLMMLAPSCETDQSSNVFLHIPTASSKNN